MDPARDPRDDEASSEETDARGTTSSRGRRLAAHLFDASGPRGLGWVLLAAGAVGVGVLAHRLAAPPAAPPAAEQRAAPPIAPPPAAAVRVVEVRLHAEPVDYSGPCPGRILFRGAIRTAGGPGRLRYRFTRSDGATAPVHTADVDPSSPYEVETSWTLGNQGPGFEGWQALEVVEPQLVASAPAHFRFRCGP
jgi:hypothetical protein